MDDGFLSEVNEKGDYIRETVKSWNIPCVTKVKGMGLMVGIAVEGVTPKEVLAKCVEGGLLVLTAGKDTVRLLPPLTITREEIDAGLEILKSALTVANH
jgi:acetylornithine/N-succinyldiaminopimelate aminotransferase